ncbi:MAG: exonuclease domain-containing protein [Acidimicrobiales bacterium]
MSFVFYDTETTGTKTAFDQILQFAAIRTDTDFLELERFEIRCRLQERVVAWPGALHVTGVSVGQLTDASLPSHYDMMCAIRSKLASWSPAVYIGYNSLQFDEHLLRSAFWKSLHNPYLTNRAGNARTDAMRLVQALAHLRPGVMVFPLDARGKASFKLDAVAPANGFAHSNAHDALADVEATIHLCRIAAEHAPDVWSDFMRFAQKAAVLDFAVSEQAFGLLEYYFGQPYVYVLTAIGRNPENSSELYAFDLRTDPEELRTLDDLKLERRLAAKQRLVRRVKANGAPMLLTLDDTLDAVEGPALSSQECLRRAALVAPHTELAARIVAALERGKPSKVESEYVEERIYDGFTSPVDEALAESFHTSSWRERYEIAKRIADRRLKHLALRLIFDESPGVMTDAERRVFREEIDGRLFSNESGLPWCTWPGAAAECRVLLESLTGPAATRLHEYLMYCEQRIAASRAE